MGSESSEPSFFMGDNRTRILLPKKPRRNYRSSKQALLHLLFLLFAGSLMPAYSQDRPVNVQVGWHGKSLRVTVPAISITSCLWITKS